MIVLVTQWAYHGSSASRYGTVMGYPAGHLLDGLGPESICVELLNIAQPCLVAESDQDHLSLMATTFTSRIPGTLGLR